MNSKQDQSVVEGGEAYQAGGNLTVYKGVSSEELNQMMTVMASALVQPIVEGQKELYARLDGLRASIVDEFLNPDTKSDPTAFEDPDFQFAVKDAHETFGRNGDEALKDELVRLLAERSQRDGRKRISLVLNQCIKLAGSLTREDYASLSAVFLMKNVMVGYNNRNQFFDNFEDICKTFVDDLPRGGQSSFEYLEAMRCVGKNQFMGWDIWDQFPKIYWQIFTAGFSLDQFQKEVGIGIGSVANLVVPAMNHFGGNFHFAAHEEKDIRDGLVQVGLNDEQVNKALELHQKTLPKKEDVEAEMKLKVPSLAFISSFWSGTGAGQATLTAIGKALAHSSLTASGKFDAPLEIWVN